MLVSMPATNPWRLLSLDQPSPCQGSLSSWASFQKIRCIKCSHTWVKPSDIWWQSSRWSFGDRWRCSLSALSTAALNCPVLGSAYPAGRIGPFQHLAGIMPQSFSQFRRSITCNLATLVMHIQSKLEEGGLQAQIVPLESTLAIYQQGSILINHTGGKWTCQLGGGGGPERPQACVRTATIFCEFCQSNTELGKLEGRTCELSEGGGPERPHAGRLARGSQHASSHQRRPKVQEAGRVHHLCHQLQRIASCPLQCHRVLCNSMQRTQAMFLEPFYKACPSVNNLQHCQRSSLSDVREHAWSLACLLSTSAACLSSCLHAASASRWKDRHRPYPSPLVLAIDSRQLMPYISNTTS